MFIWVLVLSLLGEVRGHGYLIEPPARGSMWRVGFGTPINYNDNALNCGGYQNEHFTEHGRCGVCGDPFNQPQPRDNEAGGKYGRGVIAKHYQDGQEINIGVEITANHEGYFEFRLCKNDDVTKIVSQSCLDQNLLQLKNGTGTATRHFLSGGTVGRVDLTATLPRGVTCSQCVLQWKWRAGNNFGLDANHHSCRGCGPQEEFYGCSDISIGSGGGQPQTQPPTQPQTQAPITRTPYPTQAPTTKSPTQPPTKPPTQPPTLPNRTPAHQDYGPYSTCRSVHNWQGLNQLNQWCVENCFKGSCPSFLCVCPDALPVPHQTATPGPATPPVSFPTYTAPPVTPKLVSPTQRPSTQNPNLLLGPARITGYGKYDTCHGVGTWGRGVVTLDNWCIRNCATGYCPSLQCYCPEVSGQDPSTSNPLTSGTAKSPTAAPVLKPALNPDHGPSLTALPNLPPQVTPSPQLPSKVPSKFHRCYGVNNWQGVPELDEWCRKSCSENYCPSEMCHCPFD